MGDTGDADSLSEATEDGDSLSLSLSMASAEAEAEVVRAGGVGGAPEQSSKAALLAEAGGGGGDIGGDRTPCPGLVPVNDALRVAGLLMAGGEVSFPCTGAESDLLRLTRTCNRKDTD